MNVFINDIAAFLPNGPIHNEEIEAVLGALNHLPSRTRRLVLKNNKIHTRYYAMDPETRRMTHTNAELTAAAVRRLDPYPGFDLKDIRCLCCGTTTPDVLFPGHGLMTLGELGLPPCEAATAAGICISGVIAFKYACMNVATGMSANAVATGSELASSFLRAEFLAPVHDAGADLEKKPLLAFDADFLRWMLSDGAGAAFLSDAPNKGRISLKIDWIEMISFAGELETCMYCGGAKKENGKMAGWRESGRLAPAERSLIFAIRQDIKLLGREIIRTANAALSTVIEKRNLKPEDVDWYVPHYSSDYFRPRFHDGMKEIGFEIPYEKWFTNLSRTGNTGSAAIYIILEELFHSGALKPGQTILCFIPESGRFSHCFMQLRVV